jgi:hypothetical protein
MNFRIARVTALAVAALALAGPAAAQSVPAPAVRASSVPPKTGTSGSWTRCIPRSNSVSAICSAGCAGRSLAGTA